VQKSSGDGGGRIFSGGQADQHANPAQTDPAHKSKLNLCRNLYSTIAKQGNQGSRKTFAKITARGKVPNEVRLGKPAAPLTRVRRLPKPFLKFV
jgi:hypothetical protein